MEEQFIVSARKYRPAMFDSVVGQLNITNTLKNAIKNNHLAQAFLFCGPRGVGKTTCARILAKTINCENLTDGVEACNKCKSCVSFNESTSFNVHELDAASNNSVEDIRNLVDQVRIPPQYGRYKIYIIDEVHMLSQAAFNAFLKTLEEPPAYAKFILATTEKHKIIPTILSRCQIFDFSRITIDDIANHLAYVAKKENIEYEIDALHVIAQKADGALRDSLSIFDQIVSFAGKNITYKAVIDNLNVLDYDYYFKITDSIMQNNITEILLVLNDIIEKGFDGHHFIVGLSEHFRNLLVCKDVATIKLLEVGANIKDKYRQQAQLCPALFLIKALEFCSKCDVQYKIITNKRLLLELTLLQISALTVATETPATPEKKNSSVNINTQPVQQQQQQQQPTIQRVQSNIVANNSLNNSQVNIGSPNFNTLSINQKVENKPIVKEEEVVSNATSQNKVFDTNIIKSSFENIALQLQEQFPNLSAILKSCSIEVLPNNIIQVGVESKFQEIEFTEKRPEFMPLLKKMIENDFFTLQTIIAATEQNKTTQKAFSPKDKFDVLNAKNPNLDKLRNALDLDLDF